MKNLFAGAALALLIAAPVGAQAASGLNGAYYALAPQPSGVGAAGGPGSVATALSEIAGLTPTASFTATSVCFPSCGNTIGDGGSSVANFLGGNATGLTASSVTDLSNHVVVLTGFLNVAASGMQTFSLASDDGSELIINNQVVSLDDGDHGFGGPGSVSVNLTKGFNPIEIVQFEDGGFTGLTVTENGAALGGNEIVTTAVPEPATWAMMLAGFGGLGAAMRARRRSVAATA
jgi:hypothetical protein